MIPLGLSAAATLAAVAAPVHAQGAGGRAAIPRITMHSVSTVRSLSAWPGFSLSVDRDAYVTVFAVTRGRRDFPIQVLSPTRPAANGRLKANQLVRVRNLESRELLHLINYGEAPVIVGFASAIKPDLSQFAYGKRWGRDLLMDTLAVDQQDMVNILGKTIFGPDAEYDVVVSAAADPTPVTRAANAWAFDDACAGFSARWTRRNGFDGLGFYSDANDVDPLVRLAIGGGLFSQAPVGWALGLPLVLPNGGRFSFAMPIEVGGRLCTGYRVAWWPSLPQPVNVNPVVHPVADSTLAPDLASPVDRLPRYPRGGDVVGLDSSARRDPSRPDGRDSVSRVGDRTGLEPSAWRRGENGSERRFPGVEQEAGRPWSRTRTLPGQGDTWVGASDRAAADRTRDLDDERRRTRVSEPAERGGSPAPAQPDAPVGRGGRSFPSREQDGRPGGTPVIERSDAGSEPPRAGGAPPPPPP
ncbi:MAG: hypothetical protein ACK5X2_00700, partial [Gemmatimonadaceae bacterium]